MDIDFCILSFALSIDAGLALLAINLIQSNSNKMSLHVCTSLFAFIQGLFLFIGFSIATKVSAISANYFTLINEWDHWFSSSIFFYLSFRLFNDLRNKNEDAQNSFLKNISIQGLLLLSLAVNLDALLSGTALLQFKLSISDFILSSFMALTSFYVIFGL